MKTLLIPTSVVLLFGSLSGLQAQQEVPDENKDTNRRHMKGIHEREANAKTALNFVASEIATDPERLFTRLDHDENGNLSLEEFKRIVNVGSQGTASVEGTKGTSASGAAGSTGITGSTSVSGQATVPGQTPPTYGQKPDITGQQPAAGQPMNNTARDAATAGQQPATPSPTDGNPAQNPKPAPGQQPAPGQAPAAPTTKEPQ